MWHLVPRKEANEPRRLSRGAFSCSNDNLAGPWEASRSLDQQGTNRGWLLCLRWNGVCSPLIYYPWFVSGCVLLYPWAGSPLSHTKRRAEQSARNGVWRRVTYSSRGCAARACAPTWACSETMVWLAVVLTILIIDQCAAQFVCLCTWQGWQTFWHCLCSVLYFFAAVKKIATTTHLVWGCCSIPTCTWFWKNSQCGQLTWIKYYWSSQLYT